MVLGTFPEHSLSLSVSPLLQIHSASMASIKVLEKAIAKIVSLPSSRQTQTKTMHALGHAFSVVRAQITPTRHSATLLSCVSVLSVLIILICC